MTVRNIYEAVLVEINKENAQSFTTEEFNYVLNKAVLAFVNEKYNFYATNQQISDDLRVLVKNQTFSIDDTNPIGANDAPDVYNETTSYVINDFASGLFAVEVNVISDLTEGDVISFDDGITPHTITGFTGNSVEFSSDAIEAAGVFRGTVVKILNIPIVVPANSTFLTAERTINIDFASSDYLHLISCRVLWKTKRPVQDTESYLIFPAKRLTYDMLNAIQNNTYLKPAPNRPYYQIFDNANNSGVIPFLTTDYTAGQNRPKVKLHVGLKNNVMELRSVEFDYIKIPETIIIYDTDIFSATGDTSQILELPDYLLNEVVKRCTIYLLEKASDPRVQTQPIFNREIPAIPMNIQTEGPAPRPKTEQAQTQQQR